MSLIQSMRKANMAGIPVLPGFLKRLIRVLYQLEIQPSAIISPSATLFHDGLGCVFHENIVIEDQVNIYQNVTLGGSGRNSPLNSVQGGDHPVIKHGATIFAGAVVLGPIVVGENAVVGANAVVLQDVPPGMLAVGVPAVIKQRRCEK